MTDISIICFACRQHLGALDEHARARAEVHIALFSGVAHDISPAIPVSVSDSEIAQQDLAAARRYWFGVSEIALVWSQRKYATAVSTPAKPSTKPRKARRSAKPSESANGVEPVREPVDCGPVLPVVDATGRTFDVADHLMADTVEKRAVAMQSRGYSFLAGRFRSRRYEGFSYAR